MVFAECRFLIDSFLVKWQPRELTTARPPHGPEQRRCFCWLSSWRYLGSDKTWCMCGGVKENKQIIKVYYTSYSIQSVYDYGKWCGRDFATHSPLSQPSRLCWRNLFGSTCEKWSMERISAVQLFDEVLWGYERSVRRQESLTVQDKIWKRRPHRRSLNILSFVKSSHPKEGKSGSITEKYVLLTVTHSTSVGHHKINIKTSKNIGIQKHDIQFCWIQ